MSEIDPELRDKIVETHTLVLRMDKENTEQKKNVQGRFKGVAALIEDHEDRIRTQESFRNRVIGYATAAAGGTVFVVEGVGLAIKHLFTNM